MSELINRIATLDVGTPWVWQLKLSANEFAELESALKANIAQVHNVQTWAQALLVYVAEWYKRCYQSGNACPLLEETPSISLEQAWRTSGFKWQRLVYQDDGGNRRWLYSTYVLGGLAIRHELGRNDNLRFLKALCRIYHHEDYTLENIEDSSRAVSFRQSVKRHSLHDYMQEILNGNLPFNKEDLQDSGSEVNRFVTAMIAANDEVMRIKFRLEWNITNAPGYSTMNRTMRLWLRPEEVRGGLHQYLRYDRMVLWGVKHPEKYQTFKVGLRFAQGNNYVNDIDWNHAVITFSNTGDTETGFLAVGVEQSAKCEDVPVQRFDTIIIVGRTEDGKEYELQREKGRDCMQLWRVSGEPDKWSSTPNAQRDTAVIYSPDWHIQLDSISEQMERKPLSSKRLGRSIEAWGWYIIYDKATLSNGEQEITFYNRQGYDRIVSHLYLDTIQYENGGFVNWENDEDGNELLPLIFGADDIFVRHFATKDDITNAQPEKETEIELLEFKKGAYFTEWTDESRPPYGKVALRLTVKGRQLPFEACYLPRLNGERPIVRDFEKCAIRYMTLAGGKPTEQVHQDNIPMDFKQLEPTITLNIGQAQVKVYRPTLIKEILLDKQVVSYLDDGEQLNLPYIFKNRVAIADFNRQGFRQYTCKNLATLFCQPFINLEMSNSALAAWRDGEWKGEKEKRPRFPCPAPTLDEHAPQYLYIIFGNPKNESPTDSDKFCFWNYAKGTKPTSVDYNNPSARNRWGIIFQDLKDATQLTCRWPLMNDTDTWADEMENISVLDSFLQAVSHNVYFFIFMPLRELSPNDIASKLYEPLLQLRGGTLTDEDLEGLHRYAEEFNLDFHKIFKI